jgi:hypothetical protein
MLLFLIADIYNIYYKEEFFKLIKLLYSKEINTMSRIKGYSLKLIRKGTVILPIRTISGTEE